MYVVLVRLQTQNIEAPRKIKSTISVIKVFKKTQKRTIVSKTEIKLQFPNVVQAQYEHHTAADTHLHKYIRTKRVM